MATGEEDIRKEHHEEDGAEGSADEDLGGKKRDKDRLVPDLSEPKPIYVEREGICEREDERDKENAN